MDRVFSAILRRWWQNGLKSNAKAGLFLRRKTHVYQGFTACYDHERTLYLSVFMLPVGCDQNG